MGSYCMNGAWFQFIQAAHKKLNKFTIEGVSFELEYDEGWFRLYRISRVPDYQGGWLPCKIMSGSDFYTLGRKDIHDMADDGVDHLKEVFE